jgi:hypothetical protein
MELESSKADQALAYFLVCGPHPAVRRGGEYLRVIYNNRKIATLLLCKYFSFTELCVLFGNMEPAIEVIICR